MRWKEIITESDVQDDLRIQLQTYLNIIKTKGITEVPLDVLVSGVTIDGMSIHPDDADSINQVKELLQSMTNMVDLVDDDKVVLKSDDSDSDSFDDLEKDEKESKKDIKKQALNQLDDKLGNKLGDKKDGKLGDKLKSKGKSDEIKI